MHNEIKDSINSIDRELKNLKKYLISSKSDIDDSIPLSHEKHLASLNKYLTLGNGMGRHQSAATIYNGEIGYFYVSSVKVDGEKVDSILFSTGDGRPVTIVTKFPNFIKNL